MGDRFIVRSISILKTIAQRKFFSEDLAPCRIEPVDATETIKLTGRSATDSLLKKTVTAKELLENDVATASKLPIKLASQSQLLNKVFKEHFYILGDVSGAAIILIRQLQTTSGNPGFSPK
jgi:hypothetical protein